MLKRFILDNAQMNVAQLALQRDRYPMLSDSDFRFCLQQIDGRQRTRDKLPLFATIDGWLYPPRLNLEQCSSERTARFKAKLLSSQNCQLSTVNCQLSTVNCQLSTINYQLLIDATGGYGVDTFFMSEQAAETHYFEQNADLAAIAEHNFRLAGKNIVCHPEPFDLSTVHTALADRSRLSREKNYQLSTVLYLDPARRDAHGGKVFRLEDCTPDVTAIVRHVQQNCPTVRVLLKLSPMLDFHQAVAQLGGAWDVYVVSLAGEVKELLLLSTANPLTPNPLTANPLTPNPLIRSINAVMLDDQGEHIFSFTPEEESSASVQYLSTDYLSNIQTALADCSRLTKGNNCQLSTIHTAPADRSKLSRDKNCQLSIQRQQIVRGLAEIRTVNYIFEPDAAILKAGAFRLLSARFGLLKAAPNTHLYFTTANPLTANPLTPNPLTANPLTRIGRTWRLIAVYTRVKEVQRILTRANVLTRNYVLSAADLRKQLRLKDGGDDYIIACRIADSSAKSSEKSSAKPSEKPVLLHCRRIGLS